MSYVFVFFIVKLFTSKLCSFYQVYAFMYSCIEMALSETTKREDGPTLCSKLKRRDCCELFSCFCYQ